MALFFVGYLFVVSSTVAFILAILTPHWIYPNTLSVDGGNLTSSNQANYRGIFYVDIGYANNTCRDWILLAKDSIAPCRPGLCQQRRETNRSLRNEFSLRRGLCVLGDRWLVPVDHSSLADGWLSVRSTSSTGSSPGLADRCIDPADL